MVKFEKNRTNIFVFAENPDGCLETKWTKFEKLQMKLLQIERFFAKHLWATSSVYNFILIIMHKITVLSKFVTSHFNEVRLFVFSVLFFSDLVASFGSSVESRLPYM